MLSNTCKYGIRSLIFLALKDKNKLVNIKYIAKELEIPEPFLGKIMQSLVKAKILESHRGINGGFKFKKSPNKITFLEIIDIFDGLDFFSTCVLGMRICAEGNEHASDCPFKLKIDPLRDKFYEIFKQTTIADFVNNISDIKDDILI